MGYAAGFRFRWRRYLGGRACIKYPNGDIRGSETKAALLGGLVQEGLQGVPLGRPEGHGCGPVRGAVGRHAAGSKTVEGAGGACWLNTGSAGETDEHR